MPVQNQFSSSLPPLTESCDLPNIPFVSMRAAYSSRYAFSSRALLRLTGFSPQSHLDVAPDAVFEGVEPDHRLVLADVERAWLAAHVVNHLLVAQRDDLATVRDVHCAGPLHEEE